MITKEMEAWLSANRTQYEWYLLHSMLHDRERAMRMMVVPLKPSDFGTDAAALLFAALRTMHVLGAATGTGSSFPPTWLELKDAATASAGPEEMGDDVVQELLDFAFTLLVRDSMEARWNVIDAYFEAWLTSVRSKEYARQVQMRKVADTSSLIAKLQADQRAARSAVDAQQDDMEDLFEGTDETPVRRRTTGITALDEALNGGWGEAECYCIFAGTGGGKSILAGQVSWNECSYGGNPLIVSTELRAYEYLARVLSCACSIPIPVFQDCKNYNQMRVKAAQDMTLHNRHTKMEAAYQTLKAAWRVHKVSSDESMNAKTLLELEMLKYENALKRRPSLIILDWLGSLADQGSDRGRSSAERSAVWEHSANGCVQFADETGIPTVVLAQATNDASMHAVLTQQHIGVGKGIIKNMVAAIGITNLMDKAGITAAAKGTGDMPTQFTLTDQRLCLAKARKGEGTIIPIERDFRFQRFRVPPPR